MEMSYVMHEIQDVFFHKLKMDVAPLIFGEFQISFKQRAHLSSIFGLMVLIVAWLLDQITTLDWSFWLYLFGGLSFSCGLIWYFADEVSIRFCFAFGDAIDS
jgi:hypothetical protein